MSDEKELKDQRIPIMMTESEVTSIDDWSFKHRIRSRGEAIRRLCQIGLVFDDHRAEIVEKARNVLETASDATSETSALLRQGSLSEDQRKIARATLKAMIAAVRLMPLIRTTTGLANNFKGERDIAEIIAEAKEILAIGSEEDDLDAEIHLEDIIPMANIRKATGDNS